MRSVSGGDRRPRLSVALIVRNAAESISETLASVQGLADEIMVLDTGSTDETVSLAAQFGAQTFQQPWPEDFSAARNALWSKLTGDWILWLDAGERFSAQAAGELRAFINTQAELSKAYMLLVVRPPDAGQISGEQIARIRLVPNRADLRFVGRVRESVRPTVDAAGMTVDGLPWRILRTARDHQSDRKLARTRRDLRLLELEISQRGQLPHLLVAFGENLLNLAEPASAQATFRTALQSTEPGSTVQREAFYGLLTCHDADPTQRQEQINTCLAALEAFPLDAQLLCAMGGYLQAQNRLDLAERSYAMAFEHGQIDPETWHVADIREIAAVCLSLTLQLQERDGEALALLECALEQMPGGMRVRRHLIDLCIKHDRRQQALAEVDRLPADIPHREALRSAVRGACLAAKQNWSEAITYLQTAYQAGCRDIICLRWLSITLMAVRQTTGAEDILKQWQAVDPRSSELNAYLAAAGTVSTIGTVPEPPKAPAFQAVQESRRLRIDAAAVAAGTALLSSIRSSEPVPFAGAASL
jgi:tetratricopeptide (TPR) repeat protein